jgi:hypothetical protein
MRPLGHGGSAAGQNPAASPAVLAEEGAGKDLGVVGDRLVCGFGADRATGEWHDGDQRRTPLELGFRRSWGSARATRGWGSYTGS